MKFKLNQHLTSPKAYDSLSLFEFCVNRLVQKMNDFRYPMNLLDGVDSLKNHIQWANLIFGSGNDTNKQYLSKVKSDFSSYFINRGNKYQWDFLRIYNEHPHFFLIEENNKKANPFDEIYQALDHEIIESKRDSKKNTYKILSLDRIKLNNGSKVYVATLDIEEDEDPKLIEDLPITIRIGGMTFDTKVLDFDKVNDKLFFQLEQDITGYYGNMSVQTDASWILEKIKERLITSQKGGTIENIITKFIKGNIVPEKISEVLAPNNSANSSLDESQLEAFNFSNNNDISIIWGPPGTGKSHTLATIIDNFYKKKEKTLIVCIANVAVDALTLKLVDLIKKQNIQVNQGEILRIGYTRAKELLETEYLFPDNENTKNIRNRIIEIDDILRNSIQGQNLEIKKERQDLGEKLKKEVNSLIQNAKVTFATASKFFVDTILNDREYDNLIIDEASMVSIPHFIALSLKIKKRIIITGDFRQLGPVVLSQSEVSKKWLLKDIFEFSGINPKDSIINHLALKQLLVQRRSHESICNLINEPFYQGKLKSETIFKNDEIVNLSPFPGKTIVYKQLGTKSKVEFTKKGSRLNQFSAFTILNILDKYLISGIINNTIGVISPYRGQVKLLQELVSKKNYPKNFRELIKIGTIHAFQGSECDLIIFDTVDSIEENISRLYRFDMGKRLVNVALSRAKYKLIVCGDLNVFTDGKGYNNVDTTVKTIFKKIKRYAMDE
jgi:superfamily I DNA and/or RNA helicase